MSIENIGAVCIVIIPLICIVGWWFWASCRSIKRNKERHSAFLEAVKNSEADTVVFAEQLAKDMRAAYAKEDAGVIRLGRARIMFENHISPDADDGDAHNPRAGRIQGSIHIC